jgi:histidinol-phosphate aminotransferase
MTGETLTGETLHFEAAINPYGCSPKVVETLAAFARTKQYAAYGDQTALHLRERLAALHRLSPEQIVVYNGAGEALAWLYVLCLVMRPGRLVVPAPSYERFVEAGRRCAEELIEVPLDAETYALDVERLAGAARGRRATLGLISSPNNPSGNLLLDAAALARLLDSAPDCLWIIDEAYADYPGLSFARWTAERPNLVVLRTFSKAYGLAGLRVGCAIAHASVASQLAAIRLPWSVNSMSLVAAAAALDDQPYLAQTIAGIRRDCRDLYSSLASIPFIRPHPTAANFFLTRVADRLAPRLTAHIAARGMRVRTRPDMPDHVRITSLLPADNRRLLDALADFDA